MTDNGRAPSGQALAVPVEPVSRLDPTGFDPSRCPHRVNRYNRDCAQILNGAGKVVALIEALSNGRWTVFVGDRRLTKRTFSTVPLAFDWWCVNAAIAMETGTATAPQSDVVAKP